MYIIVIRRALIVNGGSHKNIGRKHLVVEREILIEVLYASQINLNEQGSIPKQLSESRKYFSGRQEEKTVNKKEDLFDR